MSTGGRIRAESGQCVDISQPTWPECWIGSLTAYLRLDGTESLHSQTRFVKRAPFNQGNIYDFTEDQAVAAMEKAVKLVEDKKINEEGIKLGQTFTYERTVGQIVSIINQIP